MSQFLASLQKKIGERDPWYVAGSGLLALLAIVRALFLAFPNFPVFDEVHFPYFAQRYLAGQPFFDIHPPLAKWLIAFSEWLFGYNQAADYSLATLGANASDYFTRIIPTLLGQHSFSWRFMPYLFGMGLLLVLWQLVWHISGSWKAAFFGLVLAGTDSLLFIYGRLGLMDGIMYFFVFTSFLACVIALKQRKAWRQFTYLLIAGLVAGLGMSVKWLGMAALILCFFWLIFHFKKIIKPHGFIAVPLALLLAGSVYLISFSGEGNNWQQLNIDTGHEQGSYLSNLSYWHEQSFAFNKNLKDSHPFGSAWWTWPLMLRPMLYYYEQTDPVSLLPARDVITQAPLSTCTANNSCLVRVIAALGNPFIWWASFVSFVFTLLFVWPKKPWQWSLMLSSIAMYIPWMLIGRVSFLYYFMGVATVWQLLLGLNLWQLYKHPLGKKVVLLFLIITALWFIAVYPMLTAMAVNPNYLPAVLWFQSWRG